jgi:hypothetical protein
LADRTTAPSGEVQSVVGTMETTCSDKEDAPQLM